ncbi:MAG: 6-carboxytetrahydropterin synthase [Bacteroidetes bacterium]|nr:6-carboxytetrahydropterin synthase [Bacteroidota bacterium]
MGYIRITKRFYFEMAHALYGYDGPCKNVHGHSYRLHVTVKGKVISNPNHPKLGMIMDFKDLKNIVKPIVDELDHATALNANSPHKDLSLNNLLFQKLVLLPYQPTCENLLLDIAHRIKGQLPEHITLHHLLLQETPSSYAEWFADDN